MRAWMIAAFVVMATSTGCEKKAPACPTCPTCPDPAPTADAAGPAEYDGYSFRMVRKGDNVAMVATSSKGRVVVIPIDPRTRMFADGKEGTAGELLAFVASTGGCPCTRPACWPYCRVADSTLSLDTLQFWGKPDVPVWPPLPDDPAAPPPGSGTVDPAAPAPTAPAPTDQIPAPPAPAPQ